MRRWWTLRPGVTTVVLANAYATVESVPEVSPFAASVKRLAGDRVRIEFVNGWTNPYDRHEERTVLEDVAAGVADLAWVGARAIGAVFGILSLEPLHAPLLFPDESAVARFLLSGPVAQLLQPLQEVGLVGLALLPGGLRHPFGLRAPLVGPEDWRGKVIRTHASLTGEATIRALGATPVLCSNAELRASPPPGIDGMDLHTDAVASWGYSGWLTWDVPLWPRLVLLVANRTRLDQLLQPDRELLEEAAAQASVETARKLPSRRHELPASAVPIQAGADNTELLRRELRPVYDELRSTGEGARTLGQIEQHIAAGRSRNS